MVEDSTLRVHDTDSNNIAVYLYKNESDNLSIVGDTVYFKDYVCSAFRNSLCCNTKEKSMFVEKTPLINNNLSTTMRTEQQSGLGVFWIFIFIGLVAALLLKFAKEKMYSFLSSLFSKSQLAISTKDGGRIDIFVLLPLIFIFLPVTSLLLGSLFSDIPFFETEISNHICGIHNTIIYLLIYLGFSVIYFLKMLFVMFFGWVFKATKIARYYVQIHYNFDIFLGFLLFLPLFCMIYTDFYQKEIFTFISLFLIVIVLVTRIIRSFYVIITTFKFSQFYLFFYLCVVELLPLFLLCKLFF